LNGLFQLPEDFVEAAFGNKGKVDVNGTAQDIPPVRNNGAMGSAECIRKCNMSAPQ
jgi:hypothetical protein